MKAWIITIWYDSGELTYSLNANDRKQAKQIAFKYALEHTDQLTFGEDEMESGVTATRANDDQKADVFISDVETDRIIKQYNL